MLGLLRRNVRVSSVDTKALAYKSLVRPKLAQYGHPGNNTSSTMLKRFNAVQLDMSVMFMTLWRHPCLPEMHGEHKRTET